MRTLEEQIERKKAEIIHYEGVLDRYFNHKNRWYDAGKRHMEELKNELSVLEEVLNGL